MNSAFYRLFLLVILLLGSSSYADDVKKDYLKDGNGDVVWFFQEPASEVMHEVVHLHSIIFYTMMVVFFLCCSLLIYILFRFSAKRNSRPQTFTHNTMLEVFWTGIPLLIVCFLAYFNIEVLKKEEMQEYTKQMDMTIKVVGHQWYWTYEYPDYGIKFDSYMKKDEDLTGDDKRLLSVDNPVYVPVGKTVKVVLAADDVIHSWALPAFGVKKDAVPGRLNETWFKADKEGVFYGQCSELCGLLHGFMPIEIRVLSENEFNKWASEAKAKFSA